MRDLIHHGRLINHRGEVRRWLDAMLLTLGLCSLILPAHTQSVVWLGVLPGGNASSANDVTNNGEVFGWSSYDTNNNVRAVVWTPSNNYSPFAIPWPSQYGYFDNSEAPAAGIINAWERQNRQQTIRAFPLGSGYVPQLYAWGGFNVAPTSATTYYTGSTGGYGLLYIPGGRSLIFNHTPFTNYNTPQATTGISQFPPTISSLLIGYVSQQGFPRNRIGYIWEYGTSQPQVWIDSRVPVDVVGDRTNAMVLLADGSAIVLGPSIYRAEVYLYPSGTRTQLPSINWSSRVFGNTARKFSRDGSVIVGTTYVLSEGPIDAEPRATIWYRDGNTWVAYDLNSLVQVPSGSVLRYANAISRDGRYIVGQGYNAATRRVEAFLVATPSLCTPHNGDVNNDRCVDDADLLAVLFAFGQTGHNLGRVDVNCDRVVDDADLLTVLFNFGQGCGPNEAVYIPDRDAQRGVLRYNPQTNTVSVFGTCAQAYYYGIAKHPSDGTIWISRHTGSYSIDVLNANGQCQRQIPLPSGANLPRGLDIHPITRKVTVAASEQLYCYDPQSDSWSGPISLPSGVGGATGVEWDRNGNFLYVTTSLGYLLKYAHNNGCPSTVVAQSSSGGGYSADLAVLPNGNILMGRTNLIVEMDANCNLVATRFDLGTGNLVHGVAVDSSGTVWATVYGNGTLYKSVGNTMQPVLQVGNLKVGEGLIVK